ncbi:MAG: hypothetical protein JW825_07165 [Candidatus Methanofastidiosa archaeon]|nr:hypothetical protein [Candidatus Methanofastidiosa archaeon]
MKIDSKGVLKIALIETEDMGFKEFEDEREDIIRVRDKFVLECQLKNEQKALICDVIFYDELLKLYKRYYGEFFVNYSNIMEGQNYDIDDHRFERLKRMLERKHKEVLQNIGDMMTSREKEINGHIYRRAMLGLHILHFGMDILDCYRALQDG